MSETIEGAVELAEPSGPGRGRPSDYRPEYCETAGNMCIAGATDFEVAQALDVHVSTLYRWKAAHPEFREALRVGKDLADDRVEASMYHRAVGYSYPALKIMQDKGSPVIVPYTEHVPPSEVAGTLWLINRRPDKWRAKQAIEHSGPNGGPIETRNADSLSDAELEAIACPGRPAPSEPEAGQA